MAMPAGNIAHDDSASLASDVDMILIIQERDAYKQETEKLRKIIDRQRFIIKSLQDQIARKQSLSAATTPETRISDLSPEAMGRALPDSAQNLSQHGAANALGLSALDVSSLPVAAPSARKASQGSNSGSPQVLVEAAEAQQPAAQTNARPWAKSTRLSEIYADYSARHNSTVPMFKGNVAAWAANSDAATQPAGGSSFVDSLKSSVQATEWPSDWATQAIQETQAEHDYSSDPSSGGRISSPVLESSREQSVSIDVGEREGLRAAAMQHPGPAPAVPQLAGHPAGGVQGAPLSIAVPDNGGNDHSDPTAGAVPGLSAKLVSPASQTGSEHILLRPISMNVDSNTAHPPMQNGEPHDVPTTADDEDQWPDSRIADYEYGALENTAQHGAAMRTAAPAERGLNHHQQATMAAQPTDQQRRPSDYSLPHGPNTGAGVRWAPEPAQVYESPSQFDRKNSSNSSSGGSSTRARADSSHHSEHGISIYSDLPNGPSSVYSTASVSKAPVSGTPLTSLQGIDVQIKDSRVKIDERGKEVNVYMVDVIWHKEISGMSLQEILVESQQAEVVLWTVEKRYSDFLYLNSQLRHVIHRERLLDKLERLPDKDIFRPNAPTKSDKRKLWFERYLQKALSLTIADKRPLLEFLSTDRAMEPEKNMPILLGHKEGFLVKKGKNFGGWKRRYYVCKSNKPVLEYSELPGGAIIGTINLSGAVVKTGKSRGEESPSSRARGSGSKEADMFRHAFLIEERARREGKSPIAHPLWADSDRERDEWVMALRYVIVRDSDGPDRAMREVTKLVKHAKSKEAKPLMIHQIHTSINHEQGARRSIEQARRKEEQRNPRAAGDPRAPAGSGGKFGSPLSNQMWPITGSLDNVARLNPNDPSGPIEMEADTDPMMEQLYNSSRNADRPRSVSLPPAQDGEQVSPMPNSSARPSPAAIAATLSTSFGGPSDALSDQAENGSVHNPPSVISTIESSIYSSYHEQGSSVRRNEMSSRSIDDRNSYASVPDSPLSQTRPGTTANASGSDAGATDSPLTGTHTPVPGASHLPGARAGPGSEPTMQKQNSSASGMKVPFTRNSVGRIVHEEEAAPDLPEVTPHVTDDILGVGRNDVGGSKRGGSNGGSSGARTRTREDKKRGRITFMWGKRKPTDSDHPMPDVSGLSGSKGAAGDSTSVAPRRLRRGSTSNDGRTVLTKNPPFRGPVFEQPLERAVEMTKVRDNYHLPAVVYRCIEFLDAKKAWLEEGIYRQSGSTSALLLLRKEFDANRDYNLLKLSKPPDVHVVASLLKGYLRALPENILTARLCQEFYRVVDLNERHDRVCELGRLVSELPLANYTLLRALSAHLIRIVQRASVNRMTLRNIGIVFSPSLGIPVGVFSLLMTEFEYVFWVNDSGVPEPRPLASGEAAPDAMPLSGQPQMSASVPAGMNRAPADDGQHRVGRSGPDSASFSSESAAYGAPTGNDGLEPHPIAPWYGQVEADMAQDLSRYPGMPPTQPTQPSGRQQGRSNRNSIQYKVGAPHELISQEIGISIPATIDEHDIDDDSDDLISASGDPMMQLNRYASNGMLRTHDNHPPHN